MSAHVPKTPHDVAAEIRRGDSMIDPDGETAVVFRKVVEGSTSVLTIGGEIPE
jgi:hypothetical protein